MFIPDDLIERYSNSVKNDNGKGKSRRIWIEDANVLGLEFLCKDDIQKNNGFYKLSCGHVQTINRGDVKRKKFKCNVCKAELYRKECEQKGLKYKNHYVVNKQSIILVECGVCNTPGEYRVSSIRHHKSVICQTCQYNYWEDNARKCNFTFVEKIDGYWAKYKCLDCSSVFPKRFSDVGKNEVRCDCFIQNKKEVMIREIENYAQENGFEFVEKFDHTWCAYRCLECKQENRYQFSAMRRGNVRCRSEVCGDRKSHGQKLVEKYLMESGHEVFKNEITFDDLRGDFKNKLRYDIGYVDVNNKVKWMIEYDGQQHFVASTFGSSKNVENVLERFERQKRYDRKKDDYAKQKEIPLLRIAYNERNWKEKVDTFLEKIKTSA